MSFVFPPMAAGGAPRLAQFCKYLPQFGWQPAVLTAEVPAASAVDEAALDGLPAGMKLIRCRNPLASVAPRGAASPQRGARGLARRTVRYLARLLVIPERQILWAPGAVKAGLAALAEGRYDAILASYPPAASAVVGRKLARRSGLPLVLDFRDLWGDQPLSDFATPLHHRLENLLERRAAAAARALIGVAPAMAEHLARRHARRAEDAVSIPNGFDPDDLARVRSGPRPAGGALRVCYTGSVHFAYDFSRLFAVIRALAAEGTITPESFRLEFVGNMDADEPRRAGVEGFVEVRGFVPHDRIVDVLNRSDAHLVVEDPAYWGRYSYPAKVFNYLLTGKPVLALVDPDGNTGRLLREAGVGVIADPRDGGSIRAALLALLGRRGEPPARVDVSNPPLAEFSRRALTGRLAALLDRVSAAGGAGDDGG